MTAAHAIHMCRFELIEGDAIAWMNKTDQRFDVIIYDLPDYVRGTEFLYEIPVVSPYPIWLCS